MNARRDERKSSIRRRLVRVLLATVVLFPVTACTETPDVVPYEALELPEDASDEEQSVTREQLNLVPDFLELPDEVALGDTLRYVVELENTSDQVVSLDPCPVYYQAWGESSVSVSRMSYLNCEDAPGDVAPGESVKFEMQLPLTDVDPIVGSIVWYLGGPGGETRADVSVSGEVEAVVGHSTESPGAEES